MTNTKNPHDYYHTPLSKADLSPSPFDQFSKWFQDACNKGEIEPSAMTLATVDKHFNVTARMVLLKSFDDKGFVFFTNYLSLKAKQLQEVPQGALVFWWPKCQRQVRITGTISLASSEQSDAYFQQRSRGSQLAAIISEQSAIIADRNSLIEKYQQLDTQSTSPLSRPDYWGGYVLKASCLEFWQGREHRLHDRFQYTRKDDLWEIVQLSP